MSRNQTALCMLALVFILAACYGGDGEEKASTESVRLEQNLCSPIDVSLELKNAALEEGVRLRAEMVNRGSAPYTLSVCPHMLMSCVVGAHVIARQEGWSAGLLDVCREPKPSAREALLTPNSSYGFDIVIPAERLPESLREDRGEFSLQLLYEIGDLRCAESNVIRVNWN